MDRRSLRRIGKIEEFLSAARKKRQQQRVLRIDAARRHATDIAAIVLAGQPKVDEPLSQAWLRAQINITIIQNNRTITFLFHNGFRGTSVVREGSRT
jgi:hypothetical protein